MRFARHLHEGIKVMALLGAIAVVVRNMPEHQESIAGPIGETGLTVGR